MTDAQRKHVADLAEFFVQAMARKYEMGAKEHGAGRPIWEMPLEELLEEALLENIDQFVYIKTALDELRKKRSR